EANQSYAEKYEILFECIPPEENIHVLADSDRLMQVLTNLLSNAAKFSPKGSAVKLSATQQDSGFVRFEVRDYGPGIPKEFQEHIFEKFSQADGSDSRQKGGTGLGLSIVKAIVEEMKGQVGFSTEAEKGTTFYFTLPKVQTDNLVPLMTSKTAVQSILICEDDVDIAHLLKMIFEKMGLRADIAFSAAEADDLLQQKSYMAMTLDLQLPDRDGISFIRNLRSHSGHQDLPIVVISVKAEEGRRQIQGEAFGIVDWLTKPIDVPRLTRTVYSLRARDHRPRILHVEDDPDIVEVLRLSLAGTADVTATDRLEEAKSLVQKNEYDLVILDVGLPDGLGTDLLPYVGSRAAQP